MYAFGLACSLLSQLAIAYYFGTGREVDLYFAALSVPTFFVGLINAVLAVALPPMLIRFSADESISGHDRKVASTMLVLVVALAAMISGLALARPGWLSLGAWVQLASAYQLGGHYEALIILAWMSSALNVICSYLGMLLALRKHQLLASMAYIAPSLASVFAIALLHQDCGLISALLGQIAAYALVTIWFAMIASEVLSPMSLTGHDFIQVVRDFLGKSAYYFASTLCFITYPLTDAYFSSLLSEGSYTSLMYSQRLLIAATNVVISGPAILAIKRICGDLQHATADVAWARLQSAVILTMLILAPIALVCHEFASEIVSLILGHGKFGSSDEQTAHVFSMMAPGLMFMGSGVILSRGLLVLQAFRRAALMGVIWTISYAFLSALLSRQWQASGIALAYSLSWGLVVVTLGCSSYPRAAVTMGLGLIIGSSLASAAVTHYVHLALMHSGAGPTTMLAVGAGCVGTAYAATIFLAFWKLPNFQKMFSSKWPAA